MKGIRSFLNTEAETIEFLYWNEYAVMYHTHTHTHFELYFCPENLKQNAVINGVEYDYQYPCVIISSPYTVHGMSSADDPQKVYRRYIFYFDNSIAEQFDKRLLPDGLLERNVAFMFRLTEEDADYLVRLIDNFQAETENELKLLLVSFLNKLVCRSPLEKALKVGQPDFYIRDVLQYVAENYASDINAESIARRFSISRSQLDRDFKQTVGITLHAYADMCRVNHAKQLLEYCRELSIADIAASCGFSSKTYFFQFFKKQTGITPTEFRNGVREKKK